MVDLRPLSLMLAIHTHAMLCWPLEPHVFKTKHLFYLICLLGNFYSIVFALDDAKQHTYLWRWVSASAVRKFFV